MCTKKSCSPHNATSNPRPDTTRQDATTHGGGLGRDDDDDDDD
eukprot:CAMPEP_0116579840 /NCGR_PEP_ID=MMETSP0397-20121206/22462_1 /TAXON_ID=216820 /ORGANISM="Cyclophora tenuis, Strain ECT3854" /LENGTH=42 /DNA_ID= /DNA_START= /DNA_END= /DNA_ORIENTATION=